MAERPSDRAENESPAETSSAGTGATATRDGHDASDERRQRLHEANNRLAAVIMNLAFARATLSAYPGDVPLTPLDRADLGTALEHAEDAANQLARVVRLLG